MGEGVRRRGEGVGMGMGVVQSDVALLSWLSVSHGVRRRLISVGSRRE